MEPQGISSEENTKDKSNGQEVNKNIKTILDNIKVIKDFPKKGIFMRDYTPIFLDPKLLKLTINEMISTVKGIKFDCIAGIEAKGFWFAIPIAYELNLPFVPIRKKGACPRETVTVAYSYIYGGNDLEFHKDDIKPGSNVLVVDDLIATGGSILAVKEMMKSIKPDMFQREMENIFLNTLRKNFNTRFYAFAPIAVSGTDNSVLHYMLNDKKMNDGDLFLSDMGIQLCGYDSDIS